MATVSVPYEETTKECTECDHKSVCRVVFKAKRISQEALGIPIDSKYMCYNCSDLKLRHSLEIRNSPFISISKEPYIWTELRLTNDVTKFYD